MNDMPKRRTYKKLTLPQQVKCTDWLRQNWAEVQEGRPTYAELCGQMSAALGFKVPLASGPALVEAIGFKWHAGERSPSKKQDRPRLLAKAVCDLYQRLGEPCPAEIQAMAECRPAADPSRPLLP